MRTEGPSIQPSLSIVTTLYRSAPFIEEFYRRMIASAEQCAIPFELVFVDDGSPDNSGKIVKQLLSKDERIRLIELSRNFGHHHAALAGLAHSRGDLIFYIDVDLEEQPEWLALFYKQIHASDADVIFGVQTQRSDNGIKNFLGNLFYTLFNMWSETRIPANPCSIRLMHREYVTALLSMGDSNLFLAGMQAWAGFHQQAIEVKKQPRKSRGSSYSFTRMIGLFVNAITSFTSYPLRLIFFLGLLTALLAGLSGGILLIRKFFYPQTVLLGWASLTISVWFLGGAIMCSLGVIGEYLAKIFNEVKGRPRYIVRKIYEQKLQQHPNSTQLDHPYYKETR